MMKYIVLFILNINMMCECYNTFPMYNARKIKLLNKRVECINNSSEYVLELLAIIDMAIKIR
jgi:hypothetical protein